MKNHFNLSRFLKQAQRQEGLPGVFEPVRRDPYKRPDRNKGEGYDRTRGGGEGMPGETPDMGGRWLGDKERDGYPKGISEYEDTDVSNNETDIPGEKDLDSEDAFTGKNDSRSPFGTGTSTDHGIALHDDAGTPGDSAVGVNQTVQRQLSGPQRDRGTPFASMPHPSNLRDLTQNNDIFGRVRKGQRL